MEDKTKSQNVDKSLQIDRMRLLSVVSVLVLVLTGVLWKLNQVIARQNDNGATTTTLPAETGNTQVPALTPEDASSLQFTPFSTEQWGGNDAFDFTYKDQSFTAFLYRGDQDQLSFFYKNAAGNRYSDFATLATALKQEGQQLIFATNAGIFKPDYHPEGLFVSEGKEIAPLNLEDGQGNFYLKPNGVFYQDQQGNLGILEAAAFQQENFEPQLATQSGPLLLEKGTIHPAFNEGSPNLRLRSGVGVISPYEAVFVISNQPVNFFDFAAMFKEVFACQDALYLDGVISQIYLPDLERKETGGSFSGIIAVTRPIQ